MKYLHKLGLLFATLLLPPELLFAENTSGYVSDFISDRLIANDAENDIGTLFDLLENETSIIVDDSLLARFRKTYDGQLPMLITIEGKILCFYDESLIGKNVYEICSLKNDPRYILGEATDSERNITFKDRTVRIHLSTYYLEESKTLILGMDKE